MIFQRLYAFNVVKYVFSHTGGVHGDRIKRLSEVSNYPEFGLNIKSNITYKEAIRTTQDSKFGLCFTMNSTMQCREVKGRIVEIPFYTVLATEPFPELSEYYFDNEILVFSTIEELIDKTKYYLKHDDEYKKLFLCGKKAL